MQLHFPKSEFKWLWSLEIGSLKQSPALLKVSYLCYVVSLEATAAVQGQLARKQDSEQRGREPAVRRLPNSKISDSQLHNQSNLFPSSQPELQISALP